MKKALLLLSLSVSACSGETQPASTVIPTKYVGDEIRVYDAEHNGHQYVVFYVKGGYGEALQVKHDPDCKCQKEEDQ